MEKKSRRRSPRRDHLGLMGVLSHQGFYIAQCRQIGEGGAMIFTNGGSFQEGEPISVTFFLPKSGGIVCRANCLYQNQSGALGLSFENLNPDHKKKIRDYIAFR